MWKPKIVSSNDKPKEPSIEVKCDAIVRRAKMLDSAPGSMFGDVEDLRFDEIPANYPPLEK